MARNIKDITIASAALFQACELAQQAAMQNRVHEDSFQAIIGSIFVLDAPNTEDIYGDISQLKMGLQSFCEQFGQQGTPNPTLIQYVVQVLTIQSMLMKDPERLQSLQEHIQQTLNHIDDDCPCTDPIIIERLAYIYSQHISTLPKRLHIKGEPQNIQDQDNVKRIRACLLGAVRAAVLWEQVGGSKLHMFLFRKRYIHCAEDLLL